MSPLPSCNIILEPDLPSWLQQIKLENTIRKETNEDVCKILNINIKNASKSGENYSSLLLRIKTDVELADGKHKTLSFVLKAQHSKQFMIQITNMLRLFPKEEEMYYRILPRFEKLYEDVGKIVQFAPKVHRFDHDIGVEHILMEDLQMNRYKNINRFEGLDIIHSETVLRKLAEYHAASACYVEKYGQFSEDFTQGVFSSKNRSLLQEFNASSAFLAQLKKWPNCLKYYEKLCDTDVYLVDRLLEDQKVNAREFNVLNHGDLWCNNIMFQYDAFGKIKNTLFVDFAISKYGSPANDLYYFILSSCAADIKLSKFDYMVRYYYDHLIENLKLLQYARPLPKLVNIHCSLLRNGLAAYMVVSKVFPAVILQNTDNANLENYIDDQSKMKMSMFSNPKYVEAMMEILPWLDNRGLLDWI
ncbi:uncharacterized protein LOC111674599 isoform X1 [Lucilia cuprina]|uniref:uncharacterized protein LOC111674599 isoform X1 n=1 Tax=Lucilia cuprina TaxID=7375 RepID=UPI001F05D3BE|nr:uncharacterized protein LOC111674599 isoform X1 [Lucilia cuprina]XP_046809580.1 uncharacterized protein LOC111674599 isoform X1 [Lucilia cuprina]